MKNKRGIILLTTGMSLSKWEKLGLFSREIKYYNELSNLTLPLTFISYSENIEEEKQLLENYKNLDVIILNKFFKSTKFSDLFTSILSVSFIKLDFKPVFIRSNQFNGSWAGLILKYRFKIPLITRCGYIYSDHYINTKNTFIKGFLVNLIEKFVLKYSDHIIVTYSLAKNKFSLEHKIDKNKISVIGNSVDTNLFRPINKPKTYDIITIAKHTHQKNLINLCRSVSQSSLKLLIIGKSNTELTPELHKYNFGNITFVENVNNSELPLFINSAEIFILPSYYEGNPKALLEAMSCEMPCIVSNIKEHREFIHDRINGIFCDFDYKSIQAAILELNNNTIIKKAVSINARKTILENYSLSKNSKTESLIIKNLLQC